MINQVTLTGRLAREVELKQTAGGILFTQFTLAVDRSRPNKEGQRDADFIRCTAWRQTAENMHKYVRKGTRIGITGRVRTSSYNDANGQRQYRTEVMVDDFYFLEDRATTEGRPQNPAMGASAGTAANSATVPDPFAHAPQTVDISDDDLPF